MIDQDFVFAAMAHYLERDSAALFQKSSSVDAARERQDLEDFRALLARREVEDAA